MVTPTVKPSSALVRYGGYFVSVGTARVLGLLITSLTFPYLVRRLGVETYGLWSYVIALCAFLDIIADPGITNYVTQQIAARRECAFDLIPDVLFLRLTTSSIAIITVLLIAYFERNSGVRKL